MIIHSLWAVPCLVVAGILLLRLGGGRKSISQMTAATTVVLMALGHILFRPITADNPWWALLNATLVILVIVLLEWFQIKSERMSRMLSGVPLQVVTNGRILMDALREARITERQLSMRFRTKGIWDYTDVAWAIVEKNGELSYQLKPSAKPVTFGELQEWQSAWMHRLPGKEGAQLPMIPDLD